MVTTVCVNAEFFPSEVPVKVELHGNDAKIENSGLTEHISLFRDESNPFVIYAEKDGQKIPVICRSDVKGNVFVSLRGYTYVLKTSTDREAFYQHLLKTTSQVKVSSMKVAAPMPGLIKGIYIKNGQSVKKGENLFILEAMKMENIIKSPMNGIIKNMTISEGQAVEKNAVLCIVDPE
ncbi:MAG TPA: acetyl-CoA carboxylase biotin carboxyl carrier protein subunit [Patescibacteria group bacterium]|nr:acetyl-CoA carboxylase biotin carboxyl carrier protein subunit [Patescibacteria group bacterium]